MGIIQMSMISNWDKNDLTLKSVPTMDEYRELKIMLSTNLRGLVMMRLAAETGITRIELAYILKDNLNIDKCELYIPRSKSVKKKIKGKIQYVERNRYVPINSTLMPLLLAYINSHDSPYIFPPKNHYRKINHIAPEVINKLFKEWDIPWSPHKFRHFFKQQMKESMIKNKAVDMEVIKELMGHNLSISERYGSNSFEYKMDLVNRTFGDLK